MTNFSRTPLLLPAGMLCRRSILAAGMNFHGVLVEPPPCAISNNDKMKVGFLRRPPPLILIMNKPFLHNYRSAK